MPLPFDRHDIPALLLSADKPDGYRLVEIVQLVRRDLVLRLAPLSHDKRPHSAAMVSRYAEVLKLLSQAIKIAETAEDVVAHSYGKDALGDLPPPDGKNLR